MHVQKSTVHYRSARTICLTAILFTVLPVAVLRAEESPNAPAALNPEFEPKATDAYDQPPADESTSQDPSAVSALADTAATIKVLRSGRGCSPKHFQGTPTFIIETRTTSIAHGGTNKAPELKVVGTKGSATFDLDNSHCDDFVPGHVDRFYKRLGHGIGNIRYVILRNVTRLSDETLDGWHLANIYFEYTDAVTLNPHGNKVQWYFEPARWLDDAVGTQPDVLLKP